ncbi:DUF2332 domain-containing protein [Allobranchiibius sp. GilTou73]|uniref:DUF2332 domain-containing protein n=1 Tax=Allobranchiibius sp. GilTou73 TaxID=2904523 RepID=UPI001F208B64|nr:DUF2332 domain-containing protein [Allobranchiibius sp. GilTou73]UIJ36069.1 DUF2332 domain-containing protein [Allobranchiibius sp. GilTou73]
MSDLESIEDRLTAWSQEYADLPLYSSITANAARDDEVAGLLLSAQPSQARPVLLLAALHDLVLDHPDLPVAQWYPSVVGPDAVVTGDPWPEVRAAALAHADRLREVIATRSTQTNEVNRCVYLAALLQRACTDVPDLPVGLVEIGASAGLLLGIDRYRTTIETPGDSHGERAAYGPADSAVQCLGEDRSARPAGGLRLPAIASARGIDLHPVDLSDESAVRWLAACLWPEVPGRYERFTAAVDLLRPDPPVVDRGDMIDDLPATLARAGGDHLVLFSSWALTYVERSRRPLVARHLAAAARDGRPVSWITAEPPRCMPEVELPPRLRDAQGGTVLGARRWRDGAELEPAYWGTAHPHGQWFDFA